MSSEPTNSDLELILALSGEPVATLNPLCTRITPIFACVARLVTSAWPYGSDLDTLTNVREVLGLLTAVECMAAIQQTIIEDPTPTRSNE